MRGATQAAGTVAFGWALYELAQSVGTWQWDFGRSNPAANGWTLAINCVLRQPTREIRLAGITGCTTNVILESTFFSGPHLPTAKNIFLWDDRTSVFSVVAGQRRYSNVHAAQRWDRGTARFLPRVATWPRYVPGRRAPLSVPREAFPGLSARAYAPDEEGFIGYPGNPFLGSRWGSWDLYSRVIHDEGGTTHPPRPVPIPRAVPYPLTKEVKVNVNTPAGRAFFGILQAFNFMGDAWGLTRALWRALPRDRRGSSARLDRMLADLWRGLDHFNSSDALVNAALNVSLWKFSDTVMGGAQSSIFNAQADVYGYDGARAWAMLDTQIRASAQNVERMARRPRSESSTAF